MKKKLLAVLLSGTMLMQIFGSAVFASSDIPADNEEPAASESAEEIVEGDDVDTSIFDDSLGNFLRQEDEYLSQVDAPALLADNGEDVFELDLADPEDGEDVTPEEEEYADEITEDIPDAGDEAAEPENAETSEESKEKEIRDAFKEEKPQEEAVPPEVSEENIATDTDTVYPEVPVYYAEDIEDAIANAASLKHEGFFEIDPSDGTVLEGDMLFEELSDGEEFSEVVENAETKEEKVKKVEEALEETGLYDVKETQDGNLEVTSIFASGRIILEAEYQDAIQSYGSVNAMYYDGSYEFTYESEEAAKNAYDLLVAEYGQEAVIRDTPAKTQAAKGWGTNHMRMNYRMSAPSADYTVKVGVVDSGIYRYHDVFDYTTVTDGYNIADDNYNYTDTNGHGTAVSGIIAESTNSNVQIIPIKVTIGSSGSGYMSDILKGAQYASKKGAKVINISMGGEGNKSEYDYYSKKYAKINKVIVCASGNEYMNINYHYCGPAVYPSTIAVGAIDSSRDLMFGYNSDGSVYGSNYGDSLDFVAPGVSVNCAVTQTYSSWQYMSGTSMASPYVAAAVALLYSDNKNLTVPEVRRVLKEMSVDLGATGKDEDYGWGLPLFSTGRKNIRKAKINNISNRVYSGKLIKPCPRVTYDGVKLTRGVDYTLNWSNNKLVGKGIVVVVGKGNYTGVARKAFNIILKGKYTIQSAVNKKYVLDVKGGSKKNNANIQLYKSNGSAAQKYTITKVGNYYKIINCKSKKALEVAGGKAKNGRNIQQYKWNKTRAQLWKVKMYGGGKIMFVSAVSGKFCLDLKGGKAKNGANVQLYKRNNSKAQRWYVKRAK